MITAYSIDDEDFCFTERGDALDALNCVGRLVEGEVYYEGDSAPIDPSEFIRAERILEEAEERLYDEIGDGADDFYSVTKEATEELDALLGAWMAKHLTGRRAWRIVGKSRELRVTAADVAEHAR